MIQLHTAYVVIEFSTVFEVQLSAISLLVSNSSPASCYLTDIGQSGNVIMNDLPLYHQHESAINIPYNIS